MHPLSIVNNKNREMEFDQNHDYAPLRKDLSLHAI